MQPAYDYGTSVRLIRNVRNDGTYPGLATGELLVRRGEVGCVYDVGSYLQDQLIYRVHFIDAGRTVGCREEELIRAEDPWWPSRFEYRDKVLPMVELIIGGEVIATREQVGEIMKVVQDVPGKVQYHVHFGNGRLFLLPEALLQPLPESGG